jgi:hypothetical protein
MSKAAQASASSGQIPCACCGGSGWTTLRDLEGIDNGTPIDCPDCTPIADQSIYSYETGDGKVYRPDHICQDETATVVNGRWLCNCPKSSSNPLKSQE